MFMSGFRACPMTRSLTCAPVFKDLPSGEDDGSTPWPPAVSSKQPETGVKHFLWSGSVSVKRLLPPNFVHPCRFLKWLRAACVCV